MATIQESIAALTAAVDENTTVDGSVKALLVQLAAIIEANKAAPAALSALAATLSADNVSLRDAVVANTPGEEPPVA